MHEPHPVAALFPMLSDDELADLAADIAERGLLQPIVLDDEGRILDGRNREVACERAEVEPTFTHYEGDDPGGYALSVNLRRRHLNKGQQAMIAAQAARLDGRSQSAAAYSSGISQPSIGKAVVVIDYAPELVERVVSGTVQLNPAYEEATRRKQEANSADAMLADLRAEAPDLADAVTEERLRLHEAMGAWRAREAEQEALHRRRAERLEQLVNGWVELRSFADSDDREAVLALLNETDRAKVNAIVAFYTRHKEHDDDQSV
jgi:hypothetical protein